MSTGRYIDRICCVVFAIILVLTLLLVNAEKLGVQPVSAEIGYESRLFDTSKVHTIDIGMEEWEEFLETCENEEYSECSVEVDGETYNNVGIRAKGNTSLSSVAKYGNDRYSFKIEFDCYDSAGTYHGLDKISLNNIIQDNTYMKDYLCYQMMNSAGVAAPLCSYAYITVNGEEWGLYLAVEGVEESFLERNYGTDYGELYKPDSTELGGGRGNGAGMDAEKFADEAPDGGQQKEIQPEGGHLPGGEMAEDSMTERNLPEGRETPESGSMSGGEDVSLIYSGDDYENYSNIFDNAKTDITDSDKDRLIASLKDLNANEDISEVVDVEQVIRYFAVHNFVCNFDSYTGTMIHNYYLYEEDGKLSMIPWDYNLAFGGFVSGTDAEGLINYPIDTPISEGTVEEKPMLAWIFANEEYTQMYHDCLAEFVGDYFKSGYFTDMIDSVSGMIAPYVEKDPTKFCTYEEFETGIKTLKEFCLLRAQSVECQLAGTISSTADGQQEDNSSFINADGLSISDMGSMGNSFDMSGNTDKMEIEPIERGGKPDGEAFDKGGGK